MNSATDESERNCPIKPAYQENSDKIVYVSRKGKGTKRSKIVIERINDMNIKLGSKVMGRKA